MKLYGYYNNDGKIQQAEVEVEEKVILVPKEGQSFPFYYGDSIDKEQIGQLLSYSRNMVFFTKESREKAAGMFVEYAEKKFSESEKVFKKEKAVLERLRAEE